MTSIFHGKTALRYKYEEIVWTEIVGKTTVADSIMLCHLNAADKISLIHNCMDVDLVLSVVHPDADSGIITNRLVLLEIPSGVGLDQDMLGATAMNIDPGTKIFVHIDPCSLTALHPNPTCGKLRILHWG